MRAAPELSELYGRESSVDIKTHIMQALLVTGAMSASKTGEALQALYASDSSAEVKKEIINALFGQRNTAALVDLSRAEKDPAVKRDIVSKLSVMKSREATDYLIELLK